MEEIYGVYFGKQLSGKVQMVRQGLYFRFRCHCSISGEVVCRLVVRGADSQENLGILVPMDGGFGLNTSIPAKRLGKGPFSFFLVPKTADTEGHFAPIYPEEPFSYIERLKEAFLARMDGQVGILMK